MEQTLKTDLAPARFEEWGPVLIAGLSGRYRESNAGIPAQWQRFAPHIGHLPGQIGPIAYGVICNADSAGNWEYTCGVEVSDFAGVPEDFSRLRISRQKYTVFPHNDHVSAMRATWDWIWNKWAPESKLRISNVPKLERYSEAFNPTTGMGGMEIWIPIEK